MSTALEPSPAFIETVDLDDLYRELNARYFEGVLPPCHLVWSRRLTRAAGTINVRGKVIKLSVPLLVDSYQRDGLFAPEFVVCGVTCDSPGEALREILKHEMIHLWLHEKGLPSGHTAQFRAKAKAIGQPKTRHSIDLPQPRSGWIYTCPTCHAAFPRRRRYGRPVACAHCCKRFNGGKFSERFKLRGRRVCS